MTNKEIIRKVNEGFSSGDEAKILTYVANDVRWDILGYSTHVGIHEFRKELSNPLFEGLPTINIKNEMVDGDLVAVEGEVQCKRKDGGMMDAFFFDIYRLENGKIKEMRSYVIEKK